MYFFSVCWQTPEGKVVMRRSPIPRRPLSKQICNQLIVCKYSMSLTAWAWSWIRMQGNTSGEIYQTHPQPTQRHARNCKSLVRMHRRKCESERMASGLRSEDLDFKCHHLCRGWFFWSRTYRSHTFVLSHLNVVWTMSLVAVWLPSKYLACSGFLRTGSRPVERDVAPLHAWEGGPTRSLLLSFFLLTPERKGISRRSWTPPHSWMQTTATLPEANHGCPDQRAQKL